MTDEELKAAILAEEEADLPELDPRVERLAVGELSPAELAELKADAADDPLLALALEAMAPLGDAFEGRATEFAGVRYRREAEGTPQGARTPWPAWLRAVALLVPLALAVLLLLPRGEGPDLPEYAAAWQSGERDLRGEPGGPVPHFVAGSGIELVVRPSAPTRAGSELLAWIDDWGEAARLDVVAQRSEQGAWRILGTMGEPPWIVAPGRHELRVAVGPAGAAIPVGSPEPPWQVLVLDFVVE